MSVCECAWVCGEGEGGVALYICLRSALSVELFKERRGSKGVVA